MSLYLTELGIEHERLFLDTGWEHPLTYEYLRGPLTAKLGPISEARGPLTFEQLVEKKGLFPSRVMRFCTTELKVFPAQRWLADRGDELGVELVNSVGIRRAESKARSAMPEWEWSDGFDLETWRPLVTWTADDVREIHKRHDLASNPLYDLGFSRVGCFPCIHENKKGIALVAEHAPDRIDLIGRLTDKLNEQGAARDAAIGRPFMPRSMFGYHGGDNRHIPLTIAETVEWARSKRGEWQPPGAGDGCMRWGVCETGDEEASQ
jgi:3'-phosphoadenosine 5'-phosphosulfate sulfotransferase (PAPS reductase)/FAD synthetase